MMVRCTRVQSLEGTFNACTRLRIFPFFHLSTGWRSAEKKCWKRECPDMQSRQGQLIGKESLLEKSQKTVLAVYTHTQTHTQEASHKVNRETCSPNNPLIPNPQWVAVMPIGKISNPRMIGLDDATRQLACKLIPLLSLRWTNCHVLKIWSAMRQSRASPLPEKVNMQKSPVTAMLSQGLMLTRW